MHKYVVKYNDPKFKDTKIDADKWHVDNQDGFVYFSNDILGGEPGTVVITDIEPGIVCAVDSIAIRTIIRVD